MEALAGQGSQQVWQLLDRQQQHPRNHQLTSRQQRQHSPMQQHPPMQPQQQQWWEEAVEPQALPGLQGSPWPPQPTTTPWAVLGMPADEHEGSGSTPSHEMLQLVPQADELSLSNCLERAASLCSLPSIGSLPPLGSPLIPAAAAVPAAAVPLHQAHCASLAMQPRPLAQQATTSVASPQWSCAGSLALPQLPLQADAGGLEVLQAAGLVEEPEQIPTMFDMALELEPLPPAQPSSPARSRPSWAAAAGQPCWVAAAGQPSSWALGPLAGFAIATPPPIHCGDQLQGGGQQPCEPEAELLSMFSGCFGLPLVDPAPQPEGPLPAWPAEAAPQLLTPPQLAQMPAALQPQVPQAVAQVQIAPLQILPAQQQQQRQQERRQPRHPHQRCRKRKGRKCKQLHTQQPVPPGGRQPSGRKPASVPTQLNRPCTRAAAKAAAARSAAGPASLARQQRQLRGQAAQGVAAGLLVELRSRLLVRQAEEVAARQAEAAALQAEAAALQAEEAAARHRQQRRQLAEAQEQQRMQLLQLLEQPRHAAGAPAAAGPLPCVGSAQPAAAQRQPAWQQLPFCAPAPVQQQQPPLLRALSMPVQLQEQRWAPESVLQRTLSMQLQQQEQRLAQQRAEQQLWAQAAARLLSGGGRREALGRPG